LENFDSFLIEDYLAGEDLTLGVVGNFPNYEVTSVAKVSYPDLVYSEEIKTKESMPEKLSFSIQKSLEEKIQSDTIKICKKLKVTGYARLDWKCDALGNPFFLELNLTPGLSAYYSSLPICYLETLGNYSDLIKKVLQFGYENYNTNKIFNYGRL
jgi:D-alanine-D-alanine ligase